MSNSRYVMQKIGTATDINVKQNLYNFDEAFLRLFIGNYFDENTIKSYSKINIYAYTHKRKFYILEAGVYTDFWSRTDYKDFDLKVVNVE